MELLASDEWRATLRDLALPFAIDGLGWPALGDAVLEVGPGPGLTTDLLSELVPHITCLELDHEIAEGLIARLASNPAVTVQQGDATAMPFADSSFTGVVSFTMLHHVPTTDAQDAVFSEVCRTLQPGGWFVANDSVASDDLAAFHHGDVYNPVDPSTLEERLGRAGFVDVSVRAHEFAFASHARRPA